jgi:hypothetical protein
VLAVTPGTHNRALGMILEHTTGGLVDDGRVGRRREGWSTTGGLVDDGRVGRRREGWEGCSTTGGLGGLLDDGRVGRVVVGSGRGSREGA